LLSSTVLTREVDFSGGTPTGGVWTSGAGGGSPARTAEAAIRQVLGYRPRTGDTKGFVAALNAVFVGQDAGGYTEFTYTPRSYAAEVQGDYGALTGAQASLYSRAKAYLDQVLPALEGLYPLRPDADPQDCDAIRATVRLKLTELVAEIGILGGPRPARVDNYFRVLLGPIAYNTTAKAPPVLDQLTNQPAAVLKDMQTAFGLSADLVNDIGEEQNLTNFLILVDTVVTLQANWFAIRNSFVRSTKNTGVFFGTQLVLLSQQLAAVGEAVQEVKFAMDSVFLGPAERQTVVLDFTALKTPDPPDLVAGPPALDPITISELFDWVTAVSADELPRAIEESGKEGVIALFSTLELVGRYVEATEQLSAQRTNNPTPKFHNVRVTTSLANLQVVVTEAVGLAEQITRNGPQVATATFQPGKAVTITGAGFGDPVKARFDITPPGQDTTVLSVADLGADPDLVTVTDKSVLGSLAQTDRSADVTVEVINPDLQRSEPVELDTAVAPPLLKVSVVVETITGNAAKVGVPTSIRVTGTGVNLLTAIEFYKLEAPSVAIQTAEDPDITADTTVFSFTLKQPQDPVPAFLGMRFIGDPDKAAEVSVNTTQPAVFQILTDVVK
jgi:hypothetical protein